MNKIDGAQERQNAGQARQDDEPSFMLPGNAADRPEHTEFAPIFVQRTLGTMPFLEVKIRMSILRPSLSDGCADAISLKLFELGKGPEPMRQTT